MGERGMRILGLVLALAMGLAPLAGCSVNPATGQSSFTAFMGEDEERKVGSTEHPKILKQFGGAYADENLSRYVDGVGQKLAKLSEMPNLKFTFTVLNDDLVNAFALPGGYVYITRGLLVLAENEAEVAGVLGHEIGHVTARHTAQRYSSGIVAGIGAAVVGAVVGSQAVADLAGYGAQAWLQGFSREQEMEADQLGVRYMTRAGYDPQGMATFFRKLQLHTKLQAQLARKQDTSEQFNIMATHPRTGDRIAQAIQLAKANQVANPMVGREMYLRQIDGLVFGDDPGQGIRKGRDFIHPDLDLAFTVPPGFHMFNSATQLVAKGADGATIVFDDERKRQDFGRLSMARYLTDVWAPRQRLNGVESLEVNGLEAATGTTRARTDKGAVDLRLVAVRHPKGIFRFLFITPPAQTDRLATEFRRTTYSFHRLTEAERRAAQPVRIRLATVKAGETPQTFAERMTVDEKRFEWFELLNRDLADEPLKPGVQVKVVAPR